MSQIVQAYKYDHTHEHGDVLLDGDALAGKQITRRRLGNAVGYQVTDEDVDGEADKGLEVKLSVFERKILVQEIAEDAAEEIIRCRGYPELRWNTL